jgi:ATP-binding protein involved in chromosome partitioning
MSSEPKVFDGNSAKYIVGVGSGKGGVGKSTLSVLLAEAAASKGLKVGLLDADITGPSAPRLLGLENFRAESDGEHLIPIESEEGIKLMSINLLMDDENAPVIWRGPLLSRAVEQFWTDTVWGKLDLLVVDLPPGTGDVLITALTSLPVTGVVFVSTPQDLVSMIVTKAVGMAKSAEAEVLGLAENMGTYVCPDCGHEHPLFAAGQSAQEGAKKLGLPLLGSFPFRPEIAQKGVLRWAELPEALKVEALRFEDRVMEAAELAEAKRPAKEAAAAAAKGPGGEKCEGCECTGDCSEDCGKN